MAGRLIAVGDIHGCDRALQTLLEAVDVQADDVVVTLGDYIDRGPASRQVVEQLMQLSSRCRLIPILGNHELIFLAGLENEEDYESWLSFGGDQTLASYGGRVDEIPPEHIHFLATCRKYYESDEHLFLHANYVAHLPLESQSQYPLFWQHLTSSPPPRHRSGKTAIVGHTPQISGEILDWGHLICIDTWCFGGGWLTALDVRTRRLWQANQAGALRPS